MASPYKHTSVQYATVSVIFCQQVIIKLCHWYSIFPVNLLSSPSILNLSGNYIKGPIMFHKALETNINYVSFITFERVGTLYFLKQAQGEIEKSFGFITDSSSDSEQTISLIKISVS